MSAAEVRAFVRAEALAVRPLFDVVDFLLVFLWDAALSDFGKDISH
jgi:hypothetical protein